MADAGASAVIPIRAGEVKKGGHVMIKEHPCKVIEVSDVAGESQPETFSLRRAAARAPGQPSPMGRSPPSPNAARCPLVPLCAGDHLQGEAWCHTPRFRQRFRQGSRAWAPRFRPDPTARPGSGAAPTRGLGNCWPFRYGAIGPRPAWARRGRLGRRAGSTDARPAFADRRVRSLRPLGRGVPPQTGKHGHAKANITGELPLASGGASGRPAEGDDAA